MLKCLDLCDINGLMSLFVLKKLILEGQEEEEPEVEGQWKEEWAKLMERGEEYNYYCEINLFIE